MISFKVQCISIVKRKANSTIEQQKCKLIIKCPREIKNIPIDPVFSNGVNLIRKVFFMNCSTNLKSFEAIYFFLRNSKRKFKKTQVVFFFIFLAFITLF